MIDYCVFCKSKFPFEVSANTLFANCYYCKATSHFDNRTFLSVSFKFSYKDILYEVNYDYHLGYTYLFKNTDFLKKILTLKNNPCSPLLTPNNIQNKIPTLLTFL